MADWTPEELADQKRVCECTHLKNSHVNGEGVCVFAKLQAAYGYKDPECPCKSFVGLEFSFEQRVVLEDGRLGTLENPRGCRCGPNQEPCWDIALDEGGGIQAHGGTFRAFSEDDSKGIGSAP